MEKENLDFLKEVLAVPTKSRDEGLMVEYLVRYLTRKGYKNHVDDLGNVYAVKGESEYYPCLVAHIDTVHKVETINVVEDYGVLYGMNEHGFETGIGGDDKNGVYIALRLLEEFDNLKVAFFVSEEIGCVGSIGCDKSFFADVGYAIQFDAPDFHMVTYHCDGTELFDITGDFWKKSYPIIDKYFLGQTELYYHPYTDVSILKRYFDFTCINLSCGYYRMHTAQEYVDIQQVEDSVNLGREMINELGHELYYLARNNNRVGFRDHMTLVNENFNPHTDLRFC